MVLREENEEERPDGDEKKDARRDGEGVCCWMVVRGGDWGVTETKSAVRERVWVVWYALCVQARACSSVGESRPLRTGGDGAQAGSAP